MVFFKRVGLIFGVVHLLADVDQLLEEVCHLVEVVELKLGTADLRHQVEDMLLSFDGCD